MGMSARHAPRRVITARASVRAWAIRTAPMPAATAPGPVSKWQNWRHNAGRLQAFRWICAAYPPLAYLIRDQSLAKGENRRLRAITNTQFLKDNRQVVFHRLLR